MTSEGRSELKLGAFLPYVLTNLAERISSGLSTIYADEYGLSIPEWRVLANLAEHDSLNSSQIIAFTSMAKSMVSRAVNGLSDRGLVSQQRTEGDSRAKDLALTAAGKALYSAIAPHVLAWEHELLDGVTAGEYRDLLHLLDKLDDRLTLMQS